jgi:hypothetical protein
MYEVNQCRPKKKPEDSTNMHENSPIFFLNNLTVTSYKCMKTASIFHKNDKENVKILPFIIHTYEVLDEITNNIHCRDV